MLLFPILTCVGKTFNICNHHHRRYDLMLIAGNYIIDESDEDELIVETVHSDRK